MNIGLDYDDTITRDPAAFLAMIKLFRERKHNVYITTMRYPSECDSILPEIKDAVNGVYATSRTAKEPFMYQQGIRIDVWMDDNPRAIHMHAEQAFGGTVSPEGAIVNSGER